MTQTLNDFLKSVEQKHFSTQNGTRMHLKMQRVVLGGAHGDVGDADIIDRIKSNPFLIPMFGAGAKTEVPIAGYINNIFVVRRIDRMLINHAAKTIDFIDYKTDLDKNAFREKYKTQLREYAMLLQSGYPGYKINGYILWLHDWQIEHLICA